MSIKILTLCTDKSILHNSNKLFQYSFRYRTPTAFSSLSMLQVHLLVLHQVPKSQHNLELTVYTKKFLLYLSI